MTHSHTKGPWRIGDAGQTIFGPKTDQPAPVTIANLPPPSPRVSASQRAANAALIAAAPDMLEALEAVLEEYQCSKEVLPAYYQALDAINKAKGN